MDFSLNATEAASESRMLKQCRPVSELGEDLHQSDRAVKLARTDSASFIKQELTNAVEDHQMSVYDPHSAMISIYQQQQQQQQHQQQMGLRSLGYAQQQNHQYISSMKHQFGSSGLQFQQQQQQQFFPFTASQWAELEHQALIFKYMMAKAPVPPELVNPFRRSLMLSPSANTAFQLGVSTGSPMDAEPGRCRRTDGKKWRCSRPIVADQKYCERHIHRGRNRSRKAAEAAAAAAAAATSNNNGNSNSSSGAAAAHRQSNGNEMVKSAVFDQQSSKNSSSNIVNNNNTSSSNNNNNSSSKFFLSGSIDSGGYALQSASESVLHTKDQRFVNGMSKDQFDLRPEQLLFSEVSGSCTRQLGGRTTSVASQFGNSAFSTSKLTATMPSGIPTQNHQNDLQMYGCDGLLSSSSTEVERKQPEALRHFFVDWPPRASHKDPSWGDEDSAEEQGLKIASCFGATAARKEGILKLALENAAANSSEEDDPDPYTNISLARMSAGSSGGGDLLSDVLKSSPSISSAGGAVKPPPMGFNLGGYRTSSSSQQQQMMILSSPTGVLQKVTCFSDSSSSASSPGSVKNDPNHAH